MQVSITQTHIRHCVSYIRPYVEGAQFTIITTGKAAFLQDPTDGMVVLRVWH